MSILIVEEEVCISWFKGKQTGRVNKSEEGKKEGEKERLRKRGSIVPRTRKRCYSGDRGRPSGVALQEEASNRHKLL